MTSSMPAPGTLRTPLTHGGDRVGVVGELDQQLVDGHAGLAVEDSRPMTLPCTAPISAATAPRTPGASGQPDADPGQHGRTSVGPPFGLSLVAMFNGSSVTFTETRMVCSVVPA